MSSADTSTWIAWVTRFTVPPRLVPGGCAAPLDAGRLVGILHVDRHAHTYHRALAEAQEVDVDRIVHHRIELEVARDHAMLGAVDVDVEHRGEEVSRIDLLLQILEVERDRDRVLAVAV